MNRSVRSNFLLAIFSILLLTTIASAQYKPGIILCHEVAPGWSAPRRTSHRRRRNSGQARRSITWHAGRRRLEDHGRRARLETNFRRNSCRVNWRVGAGAFEPRHHFMLAPAKRLKARRLQIDDGGKTWMNVVWEYASHSSIIIDPRNPTSAGRQS